MSCSASAGHIAVDVADAVKVDVAGAAEVVGEDESASEAFGAGPENNCLRCRCGGALPRARIERLLSRRDMGCR